MTGLVDALRNGTWLTRERARLIALALLAASMIGAGFLIATSDGLNDRLGRPLGTDFSNVYAAGTFVLDGEPAAPFNPPQQFARERAIFGQATQFYGWHYPPFFLGVAGLLALMPYALTLALWQGVTLALYLVVMRAIVSGSSWPGLFRPSTPFASSEEQDVDARHIKGVHARLRRAMAGHDRIWLLLALAFPAVFINLGHGHNGFLTAALFGGALLALEQRPLLAGILFGLLAYKPQFGLLIPLVLVAGGRWRAFFSAAATVAALALGVTLAFGPEVWRAFLASTAFTREVVLEHGNTGWHKIQSVFSWARMWGGSVDLAYGVQGAVSVGVAAALVWLWRGCAPFERKAAALLVGTLLATPYSLDYDLMLLAPAIGFLAVDDLKRGFAPWEKTLLAALWIVPLLGRSVAQAALIPLAVPAMLAAFGFLLHRPKTSNLAPQTSGVFRPTP
ncbi:MAG: glycosyltransferase family 87 protein [Pseudolabrys sp.]